VALGLSGGGEEGPEGRLKLQREGEREGENFLFVSFVRRENAS
jgi:hypothetical protein